MSFENFPYSNFHELNLDWIVQKIKEAYSPDNPPENIVLSINGQTGHVELFTDNLIRLPDVPDNVWNIYRVADDEAKGIQFDGDGAYRIYRDHRYKIYDEDNEPDYPVTSVNGQTGDVEIAPPAVLSVNGKTGNVVTPFRNPTGDILALDTSTTGNRWGFSRATSAGTASIFMVTSDNSIHAYIQLTNLSGNNIVLPLLTSADIPESAGVVSINTKTGIVTLYGSDILTNSNGSTTIAQDISSLQNEIGIERNERTVADNNISTLLNNSLYPSSSIPALWDSGNFNVTTGEPATTANAIKTFDFIPDAYTTASIAEDNAYYMRVYGWNENGIYQGTLANDNTFQKTYVNGRLFKTVDFTELRRTFQDYSFKVTLLKQPAEAIPVSDNSYVRFNIPIAEYVVRLDTMATEHTQQISALQTSDSNQSQQISALQTSDANQSQQISALQTSDSNQSQQISALQTAIENIQTGTGIKEVKLTDVVSLPARYPETGTDADIKTNMACVNVILSRPGVQRTNITVEFFNGYLTVSGTIRGMTDITLYLTTI